ncbi:redoxin family protein [Methanolobus sp. ZRKC2]|uniref:redoxin family protein n=1 Tax=Methanolobus sp. ZRKC2 TaxID=3125783 RepID=UPI00324CC67E
MHIFWNILSFVFVLSVLLVAGCVEQDSEGTAEDWRDTELTDVETGETFRISDFEGTPVLVESFAVWCPTCLEQQKEVQKLESSEGDAIIHISLDTDPNEDQEQVREHLSRNGFEWYFAIAPPEMTRDMIDEFGQEVVVAPSAPVVLVCENQSARLLPSGVKTAEQLKEEVEKGC